MLHLIEYDKVDVTIRKLSHIEITNIKHRYRIHPCSLYNSGRSCQTLSRHSPLCRNLYLSDPISTLTSLQESDDESEEVVHRVRVVHQTVRLRQDLKGWLGQRHCHFKKT